MNVNFFYAEIDGRNIFSSYNNTTYSWFARQTSRFVLPAKVEPGDAPGEAGDERREACAQRRPHVRAFSTGPRA